MKIRVGPGMVLAASVMVAACTSIHSYVHPMYRRAVYADITRPAQPALVRLKAAFLHNGQPVPSLDPVLAAEVRRVLAASGVFAISDDSTTPVLQISADNIADAWAARKAGFFTALRFGRNGRMVDDDYRFICRFTDTAGNTVQSSYWHEIHTSAGDLERDTDQQPLSPQAAFGQVVEDVVLTCIRHLQEAHQAP